MGRLRRSTKDEDLRSRETASRPAVRSVIAAEKGIFLLETKPGLIVRICVHYLHAVVTEVVLVGSAIGVPALSENDDVGRAAERIGVNGARAEVDIRVVTRSLVGGRTIEVPDGEIFRLVVLFRESLGFR